MQIVINVPDSKYQSILSDDYCGILDADLWYACPIESKKPENQKALEEYAE